MNLEKKLYNTDFDEWIYAYSRWDAYLKSKYYPYALITRKQPDKKVMMMRES